MLVSSMFVMLSGNIDWLIYLIIDCWLLCRDRGFDIKWVDDTHAIGIFSSSVAGKPLFAGCFLFYTGFPRLLESHGKAWVLSW